METALKDKTPSELFEQFYSSEVYDLTVKETERYATDVKNEQGFLFVFYICQRNTCFYLTKYVFLSYVFLSFTANEIRVFIGILLITGYHSNTCERDYWSDAEDLRITLVKNAMTRNRFQKLKSYLYFVDNGTVSQHAQDRSFKVKPLFAVLNNNFMKFGHFSANLRIDEMIIMYYGRNSLKRFIRGKPIRFGYKLWALCGSEGNCYNFSLYCGKEFDARNDTSLGTRFVMKLTQNIVNPSSYTLYFDNFFTSIYLLKSLGEQGFRAAVTIRENRIYHEFPLEESKSMRKKERGTSDFAFD
ncbi:piggyBac transposable element-derived protein 3-like [Stegodyphus dumicola]|uniref:piggyBac transposable element-derived protein 3-like n=1 Tax=Stegodyphus dumicola TaxID=202533 RepID=UPI0015B13773|nr:piggyBac transposable element-derived protein 3-like [Stegodyphus dumicola]